jgi:hypothetical protein
LDGRAAALTDAMKQPDVVAGPFEADLREYALSCGTHYPLKSRVQLIA